MQEKIKSKKLAIRKIYDELDNDNFSLKEKYE